MDIKIKQAKRKKSPPVEYFHFKSIDQFNTSKKFILKCKNVSKIFISETGKHILIELKSKSLLHVRENSYIMKQYNDFIDIVGAKEFKKYYERVVIHDKSKNL